MKNTCMLIFSLLSFPLFPMEKLPKETIEIVEKHHDVKHLSLKDFTKEDIKRLSQELVLMQEQEDEEIEVSKNGCKCNKTLIKDVALGVGSAISSLGSIAISIITLFLRR